MEVHQKRWLAGPARPTLRPSANFRRIAGMLTRLPPLVSLPVAGATLALLEDGVGYSVKGWVGVR